MNRRSFIGTITALAGLVLAKIKTPTTPDSLQTVTHPYWRRGTDHLAAYTVGTFKPPPLASVVEMSGKHYYFTKDAVYICDSSGLYRLSDDERCIDKP